MNGEVKYYNTTKVVIPPLHNEPSKDRMLPFGTPIVLHRPYNTRTLGRIAYFVGPNGKGNDLYAVFFEGYTNADGTAVMVDFARNEFVLARSGT
jgi:hypothetical protein